MKRNKLNRYVNYEAKWFKLGDEWVVRVKGSVLTGEVLTVFANSGKHTKVEVTEILEQDPASKHFYCRTKHIK